MTGYNFKDHFDYFLSEKCRGNRLLSEKRRLPAALWTDGLGKSHLLDCLQQVKRVYEIHQDFD